MVGELLKWFNQVGDVLLTPCPSCFVEKFQTLLKAQVCSKATMQPKWLVLYVAQCISPSTISSVLGTIFWGGPKKLEPPSVRLACVSH